MKKRDFVKQWNERKARFVKWSSRGKNEKEKYHKYLEWASHTIYSEVILARVLAL